MSTGAKRAKALYERRIAAGQVRIQAWLSKEAREKLDKLVEQTGKSRDELIENLISSM
ncbi:ribbon-helix-helix protein, CopG family [Serratia fonticola]|uniref:ribbon-helix-helix protein, CopG family n=1 Tax=Serratia fonticola TaxID=47917 RepID=UPI003AAF87B0|nr:ribbon-helix-helix protein, CopG family [Serratia fonticola]